MKFKLGAIALLAVVVTAGTPALSHAELGLVGYFHFPYSAAFENPDFGKPGTFQSLNGIAVNHSGTGGAAPRDVYFSGTGVGTQQFSAAGIFKNSFPESSSPGEGDVAIDQASGDVYHATSVNSATGQPLLIHNFDVVRTGPDDSAVNEQQTLTVIATGGTFTLSCCTLNGASIVTKPLAYNATAAEVETAVNEMIHVQDPASSAIVTGGPGGPTGTPPYTITYGGGVDAGDDVQQLQTDGSKLTGPPALIEIRTAVPGGAVEICKEPADVCKPSAAERQVGGGVIQNAKSVALAPPSSPNAGNVLVADGGLNRISEFTPAGVFVRAFGWDVNAHGPNDSGANEQQKLTIGATGGKFSLSFADTPAFPTNTPGFTTGALGYGDLASGSTSVQNVSASSGVFEVGEMIQATGIPAGTTIEAVGATTLTLSQAATANALGRPLAANDLPFNATATQVETALNALPDIGGSGGSVSVTGAGGGPYTITFGGTLGGDNVIALGTNTANLSGGAKTAIISTTAEGGALESCVQASGDVCQAGQGGKAIGHVGSTRGFFGRLSIDEDSAGAIYIVEGAEGENDETSPLSVQKLTPSGVSFVPSLFGGDEVQKLTVNAASGQFRLSFGAEEGTTTGTANTTEGSTVLSNVTTSTGEFTVGQPIHESTGGNNFYIPANNIITAVGTNTITMSKAALQSRIGLGIHSDTPYVTPDLQFNSSPATVETAINALPSIVTLGGTVSLSGGPGDPTGSSPYTITFSGGNFHDKDIPKIVTAKATTPLAGGSGAGANQATVVTTSEGGPGGIEADGTPFDVAIDSADQVWIAKAFPLNTTTCADGSPSPAEVRIERYDVVGKFQEISAPCLGVLPFQSVAPPSLAVDRVNGELYLGNSSEFVQVGSASNPIYHSGIAVFVYGDTGSPPTLTLDTPSELSSTGVTVSGTITPHGPATATGHPHPVNTTYRVEYREEGEPNWTIYALDTAIGNGNSPVPFTTGVSGLTPKRTYEIRTVVSKLGFPTLFGTPQTITTTGAPPTIDAFTSSNVAGSSADFEAIINPVGTETSYHFDYGKTPEYGQTTPETPIGESQNSIPVADHIGNLEPTVYHFRVVATNSFGTTTSADQTFSFYPESCPNAIVRAQTGSGGLPDCRAYELVSPSDAGAASLTIGGPNSPYASPSRFAFFGFFGSVPGPGNPQNLFGDMYVASRSVGGWSTHYVGISADQRAQAGGPPNGGLITGGSWRADPILSSRSMDHFLDWDDGQQLLIGLNGLAQFGSMAPYMWSADGSGQGRLPTNLGEIPSGGVDLRDGGFNGDMMPSPDFSHYFFSSANVAFAPGGMTTGDGSVYDNNLGDGSVEVVSKLPNNSPIPQEPGDETDDYFTLPGASIDGSHILIAATGTGVCGKAKCVYPANEHIPCHGGIFAGYVTTVQKCPENLPSHLYMRVGGGGLGGITYDVSRGAVVHYDGMTANGSKVFFTSDEDLTSDNSDNDSSIDLYMWRESNDSVTRLSAGAGSIGNTDNCNAAWVEACGVEVVPSLEGSEAVGCCGGRQTVHGGTLQTGLSFSAPTDNSIAGDSGDVYFYSPEQFVPSKGIPGRRNLYVFRLGQIEFVATMDADKATTRFQVTPDGSRAAFLTDAKLTTYDNAGYQEMYTFTPATGLLVCVSCNPSGDPPTSDTVASQNGLFMSDNGRTFFSTETALLPADTNGLIDVYEYVDGRPRLISSGVASIQKSSLAEAGFVGVSADGVDVYFATFDRLVFDDQNGQLIRYYDARAGGGFPQTTSAAPCAAADECHGPPNQTESLPAIGSSAGLVGGNVQASHKPRKHRKHHKKKGHRRRHGRQVRSERGGQR